MAEDSAPKIKYKKGRGRVGRNPILEDSAQTRKTLKGLAERMCTQTEAASIMGVSTSTLSEMFKRHPDMRAMWDQGRDKARKELREMLWTHAKEHPQTAQFLAKQKEWLDYSDGRREQEVTVNVSSVPSEERFKQIEALQNKVLELRAETIEDADEG